MKNIVRCIVVIASLLSLVQFCMLTHFGELETSIPLKAVPGLILFYALITLSLSTIAILVVTAVIMFSEWLTKNEP